ncbi:MAG TPA: extracellular solute-binding protein [Nitrososphaeraceae archaeon]|nr:extracellular solute-binding protein [Nitrososphaeraceae archaeon]
MEINFDKFSKCRHNNRLPFVSIFVIIILINSILATANFIIPSFAKEEVTLTAQLVEPSERWDMLISMALQDLRAKHPEHDIQINYTTLDYNDARRQMLNTMSNRTSIDLISVDQIWLGEFADKGFLTDLTNLTDSWGRSSDWYETNWDGGVYNDKIYGIWAWTDVRSIWYWKDLLNNSGVDPNSLKTWDGYIESTIKLNDALKGKGIQAVELVGGPGSPNEWFPFLWMLGGDILDNRQGHSTKDRYWFPIYNSTEGVKALEFFKQLVDVGVKPITVDFEKEFVDRKYAVMLGGSWLPGRFLPLTKTSIEEQVGMIPMLPVPYKNTSTATIMGGWLLSIPNTSENKDLAWELIMIMLKPEILSPMLAKYGYLPTQIPIGQGPYSAELRKSIPYYNELISLIPFGQERPNIPEYPLIADHIREAIDAVYSGTKEPKESLDYAAAKSARALGW